MSLGAKRHGATGRGRAWPTLFSVSVLAVLRLLKFKNLVGSQSPPLIGPFQIPSLN